MRKAIVVRNGCLPERQVLTGIGPVPVHQPRVEDRRPVEEPREGLDRKILPLEALLGPAAKGVSTSSVSRLVEFRRKCRRDWSPRGRTGCYSFS